MFERVYRQVLRSKDSLHFAEEVQSVLFKIIIKNVPCDIPMDQRIKGIKKQNFWHSNSSKMEPESRNETSGEKMSKKKKVNWAEIFNCLLHF